MRLAVQDPSQLACQLRAAGKSFGVIATTLNHLCLPRRQGGRWYGGSVARLLREAPACPSVLEE